MRPTRTTAEAGIYLDLQNLARRGTRPTDELSARYALEGFLGRLAASPGADRLVLRGWILLAAFGARRPTRDIDLQANYLRGDVESVVTLIRGIAAVDIEDGLRFTLDGVRGEVVRDAELYSGMRVTVARTLALADVSFHVDVSVGTPITPAPQRVAVPELLGGEVHIRGCPLPIEPEPSVWKSNRRGSEAVRESRPKVERHDHFRRCLPGYAPVPADRARSGHCDESSQHPARRPRGRVADLTSGAGARGQGTPPRGRCAVGPVTSAKAGAGDVLPTWAWLAASAQS